MAAQRVGLVCPEGIRISSDACGQVTSIWMCHVCTGKFLNPERKSCGFKKNQISISNPKKLILMLFWNKIKLWIFRFGHAQWSWRLMKDWWRMTSLQEHLNASCFFVFCFLDDCIASPTSVCLFFDDKNSSPLLKQQWPELAGFGALWHDVTTHSETQTLFLHWLTVNFTGDGWSGNFRARS